MTSRGIYRHARHRTRPRRIARFVRGFYVAPVVPVYPDPSDVADGVTYGPTGADYTGTLVGGGGGGLSLTQLRAELDARNLSAIFINALSDALDGLGTATNASIANAAARLLAMIESDGAGGFRLKTLALANAPASSGTPINLTVEETEVRVE